MAAEDEDLSSLPPRVRDLVVDAGRLKQRLDARTDCVMDLFIPSDVVPAWRALMEVPRGDGFFLEWGSGVGTIALMASFLGYTAHGIEIDEELVRLSKELAARHGLAAQFVTGTFFPSWYQDDPLVADEDHRSYLSGEDGYEALGLGLEDMDVVYAYPWPGEEALFYDLFDRGARRGAHILINHGCDGVQIQRRR